MCARARTGAPVLDSIRARLHPIVLSTPFHHPHRGYHVRWKIHIRPHLVEQFGRRCERLYQNKSGHGLGQVP